MQIQIGDRIDLGSDGTRDYATVQSITDTLVVVRWDDGAEIIVRADLLERLALAMDRLNA